MPHRVVLIRTYDNGKQTLGTFYVVNHVGEILQGKTLEPAWKNNAPQESCVPPGRYQVAVRESPRFGRHFEVLNVPGRSLILWHAGNTRDDTRGCILPGNGYGDVDRDGELDVVGSRFILKQMLELFPDGFVLDVVGVA